MRLDKLSVKSMSEIFNMEQKQLNKDNNQTKQLLSFTETNCGVWSVLLQPSIVEHLDGVIIERWIVLFFLESSMLWRV